MHAEFSKGAGLAWKRGRGQPSGCSRCQASCAASAGFTMALSAAAPGMCICVDCRWVDQCQAYHAVERQHGVPHLTPQPSFVPDAPRIHVQVMALPQHQVDWLVSMTSDLAAAVTQLNPHVVKRPCEWWAAGECVCVRLLCCSVPEINLNDSCMQLLLQPLRRSARRAY